MRLPNPHDPVLSFDGVDDPSPTLGIKVTCTCGKVVVDRTVDVSLTEGKAAYVAGDTLGQRDRLAFVAHLMEVS